MKEKILKQIEDFVNTLYTFFKIGAGDFAKKNFPELVENNWDNTKSDKENLEYIKSIFSTEAILQRNINKEEIAKVLEIFKTGWLDKL